MPEEVEGEPGVVAKEAREALYDARIAPLMDQVVALAKVSGIPMVASFQLGGELDGETGITYCTTCLVPEGSGPLMEELRQCVKRSMAPAVMAFTITEGREP